MIGVIGINHTTAPVEIRELFAFDEQEILRFAGLLRSLYPSLEIVVLSTCNRTEIYYKVPVDCVPKARNDLLNILLEQKNAGEDVVRHFYTRAGRDAVIHLFQVAAGTLSLVLGENQILGQVKQAYRISSENCLTGLVLNRLFHKAFEVGKKVRNETEINEGASSVGYAAVELCEKIFEDISAHSVLLIGAGETGELVLKGLMDRGCTDVKIINRTFERARDLAQVHKAVPLPWEQLEEQLIHSDIVVSSTAAPSVIISKSMMEDAMKLRKKKTIFLIDLAVPRDIDESLKDFENVFLYDIDDLDQVVVHNRDNRKKEVEKAEGLILSAAAQFDEWLKTLNLRPTIELLKSKFEEVNRIELEKLKNRLGAAEFEKIEEYGRFLQGKYFGMVIKNLKTHSHNGDRLEFINLVNELFELQEEGRQ